MIQIGHYQMTTHKIEFFKIQKFFQKLETSNSEKINFI